MKISSRLVLTKGKVFLEFRNWLAELFKGTGVSQKKINLAAQKNLKLHPLKTSRYLLDLTLVEFLRC